MKTITLPPVVSSIIQTEWELFDQVHNIGGRASCQDNWPVFRIMRSSQLLSWTPDMLSGYREDLDRAISDGRNPLSEKYGYMMERTWPEEYERIRPLLPAPDAEKRRLADGICRIQVVWQEEIASRWPLLAHRGRAIRSGEDSPSVTSFETYLWGELQTYSLRTLSLYDAHVKNLYRQKQNLNQIILTYTVQQYGYSSLEEAEAFLSRQ